MVCYTSPWGAHTFNNVFFFLTECPLINTFKYSFSSSISRFLIGLNTTCSGLNVTVFYAFLRWGQKFICAGAKKEGIANDNSRIFRIAKDQLQYKGLLLQTNVIIIFIYHWNCLYYTCLHWVNKETFFYTVKIQRISLEEFGIDSHYRNPFCAYKKLHVKNYNTILLFWIN